MMENRSGFFSLLLLSLALVQLAVCQDSPDCSTLQVPFSGAPFSGANLQVCTRNDPQCCTEEYIEGLLSRTRKLFKDGLRAELNRTVRIYGAIIRSLQGFLEGNFLETFNNRQEYPKVDFLPNFLRNFSNGLRENFVIEIDAEDLDESEQSDHKESTSHTRFSIDEVDEDSSRGTFSVSDFLEKFVDRLGDTVAAGLSTNATKRKCIRAVVNSNVNTTNAQLITTEIEELRRSLTSGLKLLSFLEDFSEDLGGFQPIQQCINTLVQLNSCGRCVSRTPPLCRNICGALARGCYSPVHTGLRAQFENLWNVTRQLIFLTRRALQRLAGRGRIFDVDRLTLVNDISQECNVNRSAGGGGNMEDNINDNFDLPAEIDINLGQLRGGPFNYDRSGPQLCRVMLETAPSNCWDGSMEREDDIEEYTNDDIDGQANNPVIELNEGALARQANTLGTPVNRVLESREFSLVSPDGLEIPSGEPFPSGGEGVAAALGMVLLAAVLAIRLQY